MKKIALLPGDGIGKEVCYQAVKVLQKIEQISNQKFEITESEVGGAAIEKFNDPLPEKTLEICKNSDAILFGSVGHPKFDNFEKRPETAILGLRKKFDLFANLRPAQIFPGFAHISPLKKEIIGEGFSFLVVRELCSGIYFGKKGYDENSAFDEMRYFKNEVERIARVAFSLAKKSQKKLTNVDKSNVLQTSKLWRKIVEKIHQEEFSEIEIEHLYIDNATMQILTRPKDFDVILTGNMFGDILSDEAAQISGSIGMLPSASLNSKNFGLFEPAGGSAPDIADKNIANPIAQILCVAMMLEISFDMKKEGNLIRASIEKTLKNYRTSDIWEEGIKKVGTEEMGNRICENIF